MKGIEWKRALAVGATLVAMVGTSGVQAQAGTAAQVAPAGKKAATANLYPMTVTDEAGNKVTLQHKPTRIASVTEGTDEILTGLVPIKDLVLVTSYGKDPSASFVASKIKHVPAIEHATAEAIIARHPDLVFLASYTTEGVVKQIQQAGIPVYELTDFNTIPQIERNILNVGQVVGESTRAKRIVSKMKAKLRAIAIAVNAVAGNTRPTVLDYGSYKDVAGKNTTVNDIIVDAGAKNAAASINGWQTVTDEQVVALNPDVMIFSASDAKFAQSLQHNTQFETINAVQNHRIHLISDADFSTVSQYIVNAVDDLAKALYPKAKLPT